MDFGPNTTQTNIGGCEGSTVDTVKDSIDRRIAAALSDCPDIIAKLSRLGVDSNKYIEIEAELPARVDVDIILATVSRWCDIASHFGKPVRIYGWCYNDVVENYIQGIICQRDNVYLTILPSYLKEVKRYA